jgi:hypothetical protein
MHTITIATSQEHYAGIPCLQVRITQDDAKDLHAYVFPFASSTDRDKAISNAAEIITQYYPPGAWAPYRRHTEKNIREAIKESGTHKFMLYDSQSCLS